MRAALGGPFSGNNAVVLDIVSEEKASLTRRVGKMILVVQVQTASVPSCENCITVRPKSSGYLKINVFV